jgi:hypothetical protein
MKLVVPNYVRLTHIFVALVATGVLGACQDPASTNDAKQAVSSGSELERYFPLEANMLYAYDAEESGERGMLTARSSRGSKACGELTVGKQPKRFCYEATRIVNERGFAVLQLPIALGTQWNSSVTLQSEITAIDVQVSVPAGDLKGCIEVTEHMQNTPVAGEGPRTVTTYCPLIGITKLQVRDGKGASASVALKSYAAPIE